MIKLIISVFHVKVSFGLRENWISISCLLLSVVFSFQFHHKQSRRSGGVERVIWCMHLHHHHRRYHQNRSGQHQSHIRRQQVLHLHYRQALLQRPEASHHSVSHPRRLPSHFIFCTTAASHHRNPINAVSGFRSLPTRYSTNSSAEQYSLFYK